MVYAFIKVRRVRMVNLLNLLHDPARVYDRLLLLALDTETIVIWPSHIPESSHARELLVIAMFARISISMAV